MFKIIKKTFQTGIVTEKYPDIKDDAPEGFRGKPQIFPEQCTLCGDCAKACPSKVIKLEQVENETVLTLSYCGCIFCGRCEEVCTNYAIKLTGEYEMASRTKDDLVYVVRRRL
jgi:hydrogenase-4 component H